MSKASGFASVLTVWLVIKGENCRMIGLLQAHDNAFLISSFATLFYLLYYYSFQVQRKGDSKSLRSGHHIAAYLARRRSV